MSSGLTAHLKLADEKREQRPNKGGYAQEPKAIEKGQERGLLLHNHICLPQGAHRPIGSTVSVLNETIRDARQVRIKRLIETCNVGDQHRLVILSAPRRHGRHEGNAEASAPIAKEIRQAGCFVVLVLRKIRVCQLADRHKYERKPKSLYRACPGLMPVIRSQVEAAEIPH